MQARNNESGFSTLVALTTIACLTAIAVAFTQVMSVTSKAQRDSASNSEIASLHARLQKVLSTEWSCTMSLRGSNYNDPITLMDPVGSGAVLAQDGTSAGPFWSVLTIRMTNVHAIQGRTSVYSGDLELQFSKSMLYQVGAPLVSRLVPDVWFEASTEGMISHCFPGPIAQGVASSACKALGGIWSADQAFGSQCAIAHGNGNPPQTDPAPDPTSTDTPAPSQSAGQAPPPPPAPAPAPTLPGLCFDLNAGIIALPSSHVTISGNGSVQSRIYLMNGAELSLAGNASVAGLLLEGTSSVVNSGKNTTVAQSSTGDFTSFYNDISAFAAAQTALDSTVKLTSIDDSTTVQGNGGTTVVLVSGDVNLTGNRVLSFAGSSSDVFVVNVLGKITVSGNGAVALTGGVLPKNVVFNNIGTGNEMVLSGNGAVSGTFLALQRGAQVSGNGQLTGAVVAGGGLNTKITITGNGLAMSPQPFCRN